MTEPKLTWRERLRRWRARNRPRLRAGAVVTFYDPTGLIPLATMVVESYTQHLNEPATMILVSPDKYLQVTMHGKPVHGQTKGFPW